MKQITKRQLDRQGSKARIKEWMPFQLIVDGEVIANVIPAIDNQTSHVDSQATKAKHVDSQASELRFSKSRQARGKLSQS